jgi:hypothetical protein
MGGMVAPGKTVADLEKAVYEEIERVKSGPIEAGRSPRRGTTPGAAS